MISLENMGWENDRLQQTDGNDERIVNDGLQMLLDRWRVREGKLQILEETLKDINILSSPLEEVEENKCIIYNMINVQDVSSYEQFGHTTLSSHSKKDHHMEEGGGNWLSMSSILENIQGHKLEKGCCRIVPQQQNESFENLTTNSVKLIVESSNLQPNDSMTPKKIRRTHDQVHTPNYATDNEGTDASKNIMNREEYSRDSVVDASTNGGDGLNDSMQATRDHSVCQGSKRVFGSDFDNVRECAATMPCIDSRDSLGFTSTGVPKSEEFKEDVTSSSQFHNDEQIDTTNALLLRRTNLFRSFAIAESSRDSTRHRQQLSDATSRRPKQKLNMEYSVEVSSQIKYTHWRIYKLASVSPGGGGHYTKHMLSPRGCIGGVLI